MGMAMSMASETCRGVPLGGGAASSLLPPLRLGTLHQEACVTARSLSCPMRLWICR